MGQNILFKEIAGRHFEGLRDLGSIATQLERFPPLCLVLALEVPA